MLNFTARKNQIPLRVFALRPLGGIFRAERHFLLENVMSMRSSLLLCVNFPPKNSSRRRQEVKNYSTFQHCLTVGKDFVAVSCWELQWVHMSLDSSSCSMQGQDWVNIIVKNMREVQFTSIWQKQAWREETSVKFTGKPNVTINWKEKNFCKCRAWHFNTGPLDYDVNALPIELSYQMIVRWN